MITPLEELYNRLFDARMIAYDVWLYSGKDDTSRDETLYKIFRLADDAFNAGRSVHPNMQTIINIREGMERFPRCVFCKSQTELTGVWWLVGEVICTACAIKRDPQSKENNG